MQYNISPETLQEERHPTVTVENILGEQATIEGNYAVCANGAQYRKDVRGFLPELMDKMYGDRVVFKKRMLQAKQEYENKPSKALEKEIARCNISKWLKRSLLIPLMVLLVINIFAIINLPMQKLLHYLVRFLFVG